MANWYYYNENNEKVGPIRGRELKQLAQQGTITPETKVENDEGRTALAKSVTGLTFAETVLSKVEDLGEQDFERLREDIDQLQSQQENKQQAQQASSVLLPSSANPFSAPVPAAPPAGANPFSAPVPTAASAGANPFSAAMPSAPVLPVQYPKPPRRPLGEIMAAAMRSTMSMMASVVGFILVLVLAVFVLLTLWCLLEMANAVPHVMPYNPFVASPPVTAVFVDEAGEANNIGGGPFVRAAREAANRMQCNNNIIQIVVALHNYHDSFGCFPPLHTVDRNGRPLHSWQVLILPFLDHILILEDGTEVVHTENGELYEQIRLNEPWDSPHNRQFHDKMPEVYQCPSNAGAGCCYSVIAGEGFIPATHENSRGRLTFGDIVNGTPDTIAVVEVKEPFNWMNPTADITLADLAKGINTPDGRVGSNHPNGINAGMFDGSVRFIEQTIDLDTLRKMGETRNIRLNPPPQPRPPGGGGSISPPQPRPLQRTQLTTLPSTGPSPLLEKAEREAAERTRLEEVRRRDAARDQAWDQVAAERQQTGITHNAIELKGNFVRFPDGNFLIFSSDGKKVITREGDAFHVLDVESGKTLSNLVGDTFRGFYADGKKIFTSFFENEIATFHIWDAALGGKLSEWKLDGRTAAISPDGKRILTVKSFSSSDDANVLRIWDTESGKKLHELPWEGPSVMFFDGKRMITESGNGNSFCVWDAEAGEELWKLAGGVRSISPDGKKIVTSERNNNRIRDAESGRELLQLARPFLRFSPDGKKIVAGGDTDAVSILNAETGRELFRMTGQFHCFSRDEKYIITYDFWSAPGVFLRLWDAESGRRLHEWHLEVRGLSGMGAHETDFDGKIIVSTSIGSNNLGLYILDTASGEKLKLSWKGRSIAFSPNGKRVAAQNEDGLLRIWDTAVFLDVVMIESQ